MSAAEQMASQADRAALAEVLASPEFQAQRWRGDALRQWLAGWWERLTELLGTAEAERWAGLGRVVFLTAVVVAGLLLWRAARRRRSGTAAPRTEPKPVAPRPAVSASIADVERTLAAGDAAGAVRLAFLAAIGAVGRRLRIADSTEALTGRELAGRLADPGFGRLAWLHERTVFGRCPVSPEEAASALAVAVRLVAGPALDGDAGPPEVSG